MMRTLTKLTVKNVEIKKVCQFRNTNDEDFDKLAVKNVDFKAFDMEKK